MNILFQDEHFTALREGGGGELINIDAAGEMGGIENGGVFAGRVAMIDNGLDFTAGDVVDGEFNVALTGQLVTDHGDGIEGIGIILVESGSGWQHDVIFGHGGTNIGRTRCGDCEIYKIINPIGEAAAGNIGGLQAKNEGVDPGKASGGLMRETYCIARAAEFEIEMQNSLRGLFVGPEEEKLARLNRGQIGRGCGNLPHLGQIQIIGEIQATNVDGIFAGIVKLDPVVKFIVFISMGLAIQRQDFVDMQTGVFIRIIDFENRGQSSVIC